MIKKYWKIILVISATILLIFIAGFFLIKNGKKNPTLIQNNPNSLGKEWRKLMQEPEIKKTWLSHEKGTKLEKIKPDNEKTELTVYYGGNFFVKNSPETYATFRGFDGEKQVGIAVASENANLQGKELKFGAKLKFKITFFGKDVIKHWKAGQEGSGYWSDYYYFDKNNTSFQLEPLPYQWENSQPLNSAFVGKWKIDLKKSIESGFAKITPEIRQRIEKELTRYFQENVALVIDIKEGFLAHIGSGGNASVNRSIYEGSSNIFWIKNLDEYSMACFTDFCSGHCSLTLENGAVLTVFRLDKSKKNLTVCHPGLAKSGGICWKGHADIERVLGWVSWTTNREYNRLNPYFQENARIIATKIE